MASDDAPRPALDAAEIEQGRRLLAAATPGPYSLSAEHNAMGYDIDPLPQGLRYGMDRVEDARAVLWLLQHAEQLLAAAVERDALAGEVARLREAARREWMARAVERRARPVLAGQRAGGDGKGGAAA